MGSLSSRNCVSFFICVYCGSKYSDIRHYCRFQFKALDPEFGTVKEELTLDTDIVPGWEGKIIGWIEDELE